MAIRTYKVTLDSKNSIAPEPVFLRQGDKTGAVVIDATLMDNGAPISLSGLTPMFKANTADGQAVIVDSTGFTVTDSVNGKFTYQVPNALSSVPGKITTAYFSFSDSSGSESTFDVAFIIKKAVDATQAQADDYITIIDGTLKSLQQKIDAMNTDVQTILNAFNQGAFYNKAQTDDKDAATLTSAKSYADTQDTSTLASAKSYADSGDSATLASAKSYTDNQIIALPPSTPWQPLTIISPFTQGVTTQVRRIGSKVYFTGSINYGGKNGDIFNIPVGFRPSTDIHIDLPQQSGAIDYRSRVYIINGVASIVAFHGNNALWIDPISYYTDDPMPS